MKRKMIRLDQHTAIDLDALTMPEGGVPLTNGIGGEVIGSVSEVEFQDGNVYVKAKVDDPYVSERLFGRYSAGDFSVAPTPPQPKLCYFCGVNKCDDLVDYYDNCLCCSDGHVQ